MPALLQYRRRINSIWAQITTADAGASDANGGIWAQASDGSPGLLLADASIDVTTTGFKSVTLGAELVLNPGVYWVGFKADSTTVSGRGVNANGETYLGQWGVAQFSTFRHQLIVATGQSGALIDNPTITGSIDNGIMVGFDA